MKDTELTVATGHVRGALLVMKHRRTRLETTKTKLSRHYNTLIHTEATINLLHELEGFLIQDPDNWDDEPESVPF